VNMETAQRQMTKKAFRELLNRKFPAQPGMASDPGYRKGDRGQFGPTKRAYGDYLWHQDRCMFDEDYRQYLAGKLDHLDL
jgi:hypothetical protein